MLIPLQINFSFDLLSTGSKLEYLPQCTEAQISGYHPIVSPARTTEKSFIVCRGENCLHSVF